jgi:DNA-binding CsgD family transcriptional regulator/tetratricopeptide (TPR) repeat protein
MTVVDLTDAGRQRQSSPSRVDGMGTLDRMLVGRRGLSPVLIGRSGAIDGLKVLVGGRSVDPDNLPNVALVAGEAGIGKSRLLRELVGSLPDDTIVLTADAEPGSLGRPFDGIRSMLGEVPTSPGGDSRAAAADRIVSMVAGQPALLIFEDLHWADSDSVAVFEQIASMTLPSLTLVATYRPDDLTSRLPGGEMLVRLERRRHVHQVHLDRLDRYEIAAFVGAVTGHTPSTRVTESLLRRTGGNPFFLEEILGAAGDTDPESLADRPLPWSLNELVSRQLDGLSSDERRVVESAAVLGARARFDVLAALSQRSEDELIANLRSLVERGLLVEEDDDRFSFRHELVRDAVESQLLGRERRRLHEQALDTLSQTNCSDIADLARHAAGAGRYDEMVELARDGVAHYLQIGSTFQALQLAVTALTEAPDDVDLLAGAARAAWLIGVYDEAWSHVGRLLGITAGGPVETRQAGVRLAARIAHERQDRDRLWALTDELVQAVDQLPPSEERARSMATVAQMYMLNHRPEDAVQWAERSADEADEVGAKGVRAQAMVERATSLTDIPERRDEGVVALTDAIAEAERIEDWVLVARGLNNLANVVTAAERRGYIERMREAGRRAGFDHMAAGNYFIRLADALAGEGDASAALRHLERASDYLQAKSRDWELQLRVTLCIEGDRLDEAEALMATWVPPPPDDPGDPGDMYPASRAVRLAARRGDLAAAAAAFAEVQAWPRCSKAYVAGDLIMTLEAALLVGIPETDVRAAADRCQILTTFPDLGEVLEAVVAGALARHDDVIERLEGRLDEVAREMPVPYQASLHLYLARALAAHSRLADARTEAATARRMLGHWPGWRRDAVDALLQRLDGAVEPSGDGDAALTRRELEVAALLAEGLSNADLARRLFISPKTAAVHVSNILMKLGMSSRSEVAAWYVRQNLRTGADRRT